MISFRRFFVSSIMQTAFLFTLLLFFTLEHTNGFSLSPTPPLSSTGTIQTGEIWKWKGYDIYTVKSSISMEPNSKPAILLIHGFGCSSVYWRETFSALVKEGFNVHAIDLLGQGKSSKPGRKDGIEYTIDLWAELVEDYATQCILSSENNSLDEDGKGIVLMGNSLGSLVALNAATGDYLRNSSKEGYISRYGRIRGICLFNCAVGLNSRNVVTEPNRTPLSRFFLTILLDVLDALIFKNIFLLTYLLKNVVTKDLLRDTLKSLYISSPDRVDDELVESFFAPAKDQGSPEALSQIYTNDAGRSPIEIHEDPVGKLKLKGVPLQLVWGDKDGITPLAGGVGQFYTDLAKSDDSGCVKLGIIKNCGHIPFDDCPEQSNDIVIQWLQENVLNKKHK